MIKKIMGWVTYVLSAIALITLVSTWSVKKERERVANSTLEAKVDRLLVSDSVKTVQWDNYVEQQGQFHEAVLDSIANVSKRTRSLEKSYIRFVERNTQSTDEIREYLKGITWEEKKTLNQPSGASGQ